MGTILDSLNSLYYYSNEIHNLLIFLGLIFLAYGILSCFFGYRIFKIILGILGFIFGGIILALISGLNSGDSTSAIAAAIIGCIIGAIVAVKVYFIGVFLIGASTGAFIGFILAANLSDSYAKTGTVVLFAIIAGILAVVIKKIAIMLSTAISGGQFITLGVMLLAGFEYNSDYNSIWIILAIVGFIVQFAVEKNSKTKGKYGYQEPGKKVMITQTAPLSNICVACGKGNILEATYCAGCGNSLKHKEEAIESTNADEDLQHILCVSCGKQNNKNVLFCSNCGISIKSNV